VTATSSTGASLHVIYGGVDIGSFASGGVLQFRYQAAKTGPLLIPMDQFNAGNVAPVWVVSEDGGAVNAGNSYLR